MFVRTSLVALVLASPAWADPDYRRSTTRHQPLRGGGIIPQDKRKTRPESALAAAATIASGAIHGRNHAEPIVHPQILGESGRLPPRRVARSPIVQSPALTARDACLEFGHERSDRGRTHGPLQRSAQRVCSIFVLSEPERQSIKVGPNIGLRFLEREGSRHRAQGAPEEAGL
jgi:hypothetical protein